MDSSRAYQRRHLRAPFKQEIMFVDDKFVFKANTLNISEGGLLLDNIGHFPEKEDVPFLVMLPQLPYLKNYSYEKLKNFNQENFAAKSIRFKAKLVRKIGIGSKVDAFFSTKIGLMITDISEFDRHKIKHYVDTFSSNLIFLQVLIDNISSDKINLEKVRRVSRLLGYSEREKISMLRKQVEIDYKSLQWL